MSQPLVSIIIPTYNRAHLISETLNSIRLQTYLNWECIIVDDGSTDTSETVISEFCQQDNRFQFFKRPENKTKGANTCRNLGLQYSKGDYINWFDSDDVMFEDFLEKKINAFIQNPETEVVSSGFVKYNPETKATSKEYNTKLKNTPLHEYAQNHLSLNTPTFLYRRAVLQEHFFNEALTRAQDLDFTFRVISKPNLKMTYVNDVLFKVLIHNDSITGKFVAKTSIEHLKSELKVRKHIAFFYLKHEQKPTKYIFDNYLKTIKKILENRQFFFAFQELWQVPKIGFSAKAQLYFIALGYALTGKGIASFSKAIKKIKV
jgi:glycosyltransferase involved in cell wall biosynthesis